MTLVRNRNWRTFVACPLREGVLKRLAGDKFVPHRVRSFRDQILTYIVRAEREC